MSGYKYRGDRGTMTDDEVQRRVAAARAQAAGNGQPAQPPKPAPSAPPAAKTLKGAVKVSAFPEKSKYPFPEIARDGGIWKLDPAAFLWNGKPTKDTSIRTAAWKWGDENGLKAKVVLDGGFVYVQFLKGGPS